MNKQEVIVDMCKASPDHERTEAMLSSLIWDSEEVDDDTLLEKAIIAYVTMTKGCSCLCKWPLAFKNTTWLMMMKIAT